MKHVDILLPFGLPPTELARDILRDCHAPALATLLSRHRHTSVTDTQIYDPFSRSLPHEHWLSRQLGVNAINPEEQANNSPSVATTLMRAYGLPVSQGFWFVLHPVHIHVGRDHLVLTNVSQLELSEEESRRLFASAQDLFTQDGRTLLYGDARTWFMRADDWQNLRTSSPDAASGRNIDIWMPQGSGEKAWRKLQNEIQIQWFSEPLHEERELRGLKPINSLWLWGGAASDMLQNQAPSQSVYQHVWNLPGWTHALWQQHQQQESHDLPHVLEQLEKSDAGTSQRALLVLRDLIEPGLTDEWGYWRQCLEELDATWLTPLMQALRQKRLHQLTLILSGQDRLLQRTVTRASLRKFWITPSLSSLYT